MHFTVEEYLGYFQCSFMSFAGQVHSFILDTYIGVELLNYEFGYMLGFNRYSQHFLQSQARYGWFS